MEKQNESIDVVMDRIQKSIASLEPGLSLNPLNSNYNVSLVMELFNSTTRFIPAFPLSELVDYAINNGSPIPGHIIRSEPQYNFYFMQICSIQSKQEIRKILSVLMVDDSATQSTCLEVLDRILSIEIGLENNGVIDQKKLNDAKASFCFGEKLIIQKITSYINDNELSNTDFAYLRYYLDIEIECPEFRQFFFSNWTKAVGIKDIYSLTLINNYLHDMTGCDNDKREVKKKLSQSKDFLFSDGINLTEFNNMLQQVGSNLGNAGLNIGTIKRFADINIKKASISELINNTSIIGFFYDHTLKSDIFEVYTDAFFAKKPCLQDIQHFDSKPEIAEVVKGFEFDRYLNFFTKRDKRIAEIIDADNDPKNHLIYYDMTKTGHNVESKAVIVHAVLNLN